MSAEAIYKMTSSDPDLANALNINYVPTTTTTATTGYVTANRYWPSTYQWYGEDKTKTAFAIAKNLLSSKTVKMQSIEKFIKLVELIEAEL